MELDRRHQRSNQIDERGGGGEGIDTRSHARALAFPFAPFFFFGTRCVSPDARHFSSPSPRPSQRCVILWELVGIGNSMSLKVWGNHLSVKRKVSNLKWRRRLYRRTIWKSWTGFIYGPKNSNLKSGHLWKEEKKRLNSAFPEKLLKNTDIIFTPLFPQPTCEVDRAEQWICHSENFLFEFNAVALGLAWQNSESTVFFL